jgi:hypothetical protein
MYDLRILLIWFALGFLLYLISVRPETEKMDELREPSGKIRVNGDFTTDWGLQFSSSDQVLIKRLKETNFVESFDRNKFKVADCPVDLIPFHVIENLGIFPLKIEGEFVVLAMLNPFDLKALDLVREITGLNVKPVAIAQKDFRSIVDRNLESVDQA